MIRRRFGRWEVIGPAEPKRDGASQRRYWRCRCDCGTERNVQERDLVRSRSQSCGCSHRLTLHAEPIRETDACYLAGFFDGEGCVQIQGKQGIGRTYQLTIEIVNTYEPVIRWIGEIAGGSVEHIHRKVDIRPTISGTHRRAILWRWRASSEHAASVLRAMLPYLKVKRDEAELGIRFQEHVHSYVAPRRIGLSAGRPAVHPAAKVEREKMVDALKQMKIDKKQYPEQRTELIQ